MNKEEIEKAKEWLNWMKKKDLFTPYISNIIQYINQLEEIKGMKEAIELAGMDIKSLLNFKYENKRLKNKIDQLEFQIQAKEKENKYDVNMIDEVKGEAVKLYKKIRQLEQENKQLKISYKLMENEAMKDGLKERQKLNKIIDEMAKAYMKVTSEKYRIKHICEKGKCQNEECHEDDWTECIKQYFEKKAEEK